MKAIFWLLGLAFAAVGLALLATLDLGNVAFFVPPYRVDLSLNLFVLLLVVGFILLFMLVRLLLALQNLPKQVQKWRSRVQAKHAAQAIRGGLQAFYEGRFAKAERFAKQATQQNDWADLAKILSARAAQRMQEFERAERALQDIRSDSGLRTALLMTRAEMQLDQRNPEGALDTIDELNRSGARHIAALRVALRAHQLAGNWREVLRHLRILTKREALHPVALQQMRLNAYQKLFSEEARNPDGLLALWRSLPPAERQHAGVAAAGARSLLQAGLPQAAAIALEEALAASWSSELVRLYANCASPSHAANRHLLEQAERWKHQHPGDAALLATLGKLCLHEQLWGKAREYLQHALKLEPKAETHLALAELAQATEDAEGAAIHYKAAAQLALR